MDRSVMIVDDNSPVRQALMRLFAEAGFVVCGEADSGAAAIEKAPSLNPGLIVMDLSMPRMNGIQAARCLKQLLPSVVIIVLSNYGAMLSEQESRSLGIAAIVSKAECLSVLLYVARTIPYQTPT